MAVQAEGVFAADILRRPLVVFFCYCGCRSDNFWAISTAAGAFGAVTSAPTLLANAGFTVNIGPPTMTPIFLVLRLPAQCNDRRSQSVNLSVGARSQASHGKPSGTRNVDYVIDRA